MKVWFDSGGKGQGSKYYATVTELTIDKDGNPVYVRPVPFSEDESIPAECLSAAGADTGRYVSEDDATIMKYISDISDKIDDIIDYLDEEKSADEASLEEVPAEEPAEEEVIEEAAAGDIQEEADAAGAPEVPGAPEVKAPARRSPFFAEKMVAADEILQDRYDELKNYALRFRRLKSRISRKFDSINLGRLQFIKLSVAGKSLKLYLNMDIATTEPKFHCKDMTDTKTYVTVPTMLRIKSGRAMKYAKILIDQCAEQHGFLERRKPFEVDAMALIEESLERKREAARQRALAAEAEADDDDEFEDVSTEIIDNDEFDDIPAEAADIPEEKQE